MKMQSSPSQAGVYIAEGPPQADFFYKDFWFEIGGIPLKFIEFSDQSKKNSACGGQNHYKIEHPAHLD